MWTFLHVSYNIYIWLSYYTPIISILVLPFFWELTWRILFDVTGEQMKLPRKLQHKRSSSSHWAPRWSSSPSAAAAIWTALTCWEEVCGSSPAVALEVFWWGSKLSKAENWWKAATTQLLSWIPVVCFPRHLEMYQQPPAVISIWSAFRTVGTDGFGEFKSSSSTYFADSGVRFLGKLKSKFRFHGCLPFRHESSSWFQLPQTWHHPH